MSFKPILVSLCEHSSYHNESNSDYFSQYFDLYQFDPDVNYKSDVVFVYRSDEDLSKVSECNNKFISECFWEKYNPCSLDRPNTLYLNNLHFPEYFWFEELNNPNNNQNNLPLEKGSKLFFMPMKKSFFHRDDLFDRVDKSNAIFSFVDRGILLENNFVTDRYYEDYWYADTQFSIVSETLPFEVFLTEKTFKPIMYGHPFLVWTGPGHLKEVRKLGFETFDCVFDESYDNELDYHLRLQKLLKNVHEIEYTSELIKRLQHNINHFWNNPIIFELAFEKTVKPVLEFING